jgi:hypothetical protein
MRLQKNSKALKMIPNFKNKGNKDLEYSSSRREVV